MIRLNPGPRSLIYPVNSDTDLDSVQHLIVLVPMDADYSAATRRIWELANVTGMHVYLLALYKDATEEPSLRRRLVAMASLLQDGRIFADVKVEIGTNWVQAVKSIYQAGDMIVCFAEQRIGLLQRSLSQILESNIKATIYVLSGLTSENRNSSKYSQIGFWLGSLGLIIGFGILQAQVVQLPEGWFQNVLLILSIIPEFWLIWVWNNIFS